MRDGTIAASMLTDLVRYLDASGVHPAPVLQAAGIAPEHLADPDHRIPSAAMARAWEAAERATGDPDLGLHSAEEPRSGTLGILGYLLLTSATLRDAIDAGARWFSVLNAGYALVAEDHHDTLTIVLQQRTGVESALARAPRQIVETILLGTVRQMAILSGRPIRPIAVRFRHGAPATGTAEHIRCFGSVVTFRAEHDAIVYPASVGQLPIPSAHPGIRAALTAQADLLQATVDNVGGVVGRIRTEVHLRLRGRTPTIQEVAKALAMSSRSVQRALQEAGTTFQGVLDEVRRDLATRTLAAPGTTAAEVGFLLGFTEPASFTRAFKRWTGHPPTAFMRDRRAEGVSATS